MFLQFVVIRSVHNRTFHCVGGRHTHLDGILEIFQITSDQKDSVSVLSLGIPTGQSLRSRLHVSIPKRYKDQVMKSKTASSYLFH